MINHQDTAHKKEAAEDLHIFHTVTDRFRIAGKCFHDRTGKEPDYRTEYSITDCIHQIGTSDSLFYTIQVVRSYILSGKGSQ